jgi:hypothetical protein
LFVWNAGWRAPFERLGIGFCCVTLLQRLCRSSRFTSLPFQICFIA